MTVTWQNPFFETGNSDGLPPDTRVDTRDSLSDPAVEVLGGQMQMLMPRGAAWGTPDGVALDPNSTLAKLCNALAAPWQALYRNAWSLTQESRALTVDQTLAAWERDFGLPDPCVEQDRTRGARIQAVLAKVRSSGTIHPRDYIDLAAALGFEIQIEEPQFFECGFSECAGEHTTGSSTQNAYWVVYVVGKSVAYFRAGEDVAGADRLFDLPDVGPLECKFREVAPAWSLPVFRFGKRLPFTAIIDNAGLAVLDDQGLTVTLFS